MRGLDALGAVRGRSVPPARGRHSRVRLQLRNKHPDTPWHVSTATYQKLSEELVSGYQNANLYLGTKSKETIKYADKEVVRQYGKVPNSVLGYKITTGPPEKDIQQGQLEKELYGWEQNQSMFCLSLARVLPCFPGYVPTPYYWEGALMMDKPEDSRWAAGRHVGAEAKHTAGGLLLLQE